MKKSPSPPKGAAPANNQPTSGKPAKKSSPARAAPPAQTSSSHSPEGNKKPLFFFKPNEPHAQMSAIVGHPVDHADPERWSPIYFHCTEQFMMYCKAGCFNDTATQKLIMATDDAKEQKRLGRQTAGFDAAVWDLVKSDIVVLGDMAKFGQNKGLRTILLATSERPLAEAAKEDRVWGIGFTAQEASVHKDQSRWSEYRGERVEGREGADIGHTTMQL